MPLNKQTSLKTSMLNKEVSSTIFEPLVWLDLRLNPGLPTHWQTLYSLGQWANNRIRTSYTKIGIDRIKNYKKKKKKL